MKINLPYIRVFTFVGALILLLQSCLPCSYLDCLTSNYYGQFRIVSAVDGKDLVFGSSKLYDKNRIRFYSFTGIDTTFFEYEVIKFSNTGYDSILYVNFFPQRNIAYMDLGNGDIDTLDISYNTFGTKCCGTITEITNFRFNNSVDIPGNKGTQELKK
jgi:hypothetical protein